MGHFGRKRKSGTFRTVPEWDSKEYDMKFFEQVYEVVIKIPKGKVATYGDVARLVGNPRASRAVGCALHSNPYYGVVPCHRVVNARGEVCKGFVFGGEDAQRKMLEDEGILFESGKINMNKYRWES